MDDSFDHQDVDRAKTFWAKENVDQVFSVLYKHLDHLREVLKTNTATDKERVQALKLFDCMDWTVLSPSSDTPVVRVVVGADDVLQDELCQHSPTYTPPQSAASPAGSEELLCPLVPIQLQYRLHVCCKTCLPTLPDMHQSTPPFWAQNPLKVPLLCHFKRMMAMPLMLSKGGSANNHQQTGAFEEEEDEDHCDVIYKAPCGQSLRNYDDVMRFLFATDSYDVLQLDYFSFNMAVQLDPPAAQGPWLPEIDLSRGTEPTPVELCVGPDDTRPAEFRYRKDRWPHGCFLSRDPLFDACCDCTDGCLDAQHCACIAMTGAGHHYTHQRLTKPLPSGLFECGPWCSCDRARCQNRIVQRGIKVRLQVFWTDRCGWGVRCLDDLDAGMFVCIFAGVILQRVQKPNEPPPPKLTRVDLPSDDEVEVVTEWLALPVLEGSNLEAPEPTSPPLHVPVIQRPTEVNAHQDEDKAKKVDMMTANADGSGNKTDSQKSLKRVVNPGDVYLLDARKEGNHSCQPNLFIQNVFTDSHDPDFPITAFFTNSVVKAGTELTWNYSLNTHVSPKQQQEVVCVCGSDDCLGKFMTENLCKTCGFGSGDACEST
ncbi:histone-lysine N-methyltransferase SETDB2 isoform X2 [Dunckerocampus dactyliophorus]|uniref:histone-lysine N-methyltransferase SETDB2 isoform X2 n=1 Tax=Dunckerocampus dactyliophorus TaxID=161453 RepID=UPI002405E3EE|nr:histone-lysine N-methyltransferase SETDB2 isoform X2 [Dunckerocampus dactyliophorus]